jgi:hypothetical protein
VAIQPLDTSPATLFNTHMIDLGNRIGTFCNFLLLVDGGILSITIGAFLSDKPVPSLAPYGLFAIRNGWYLLTIGMILALSITLFVLLGQLAVHKQWRESFNPQATEVRMMNGPPWIGKAIRIGICLAYVTSILGIACVSYGAVQMLRLPSAAP